MTNLTAWVKQKRLVTVTPLAKPQVLVDFERTHGATPKPMPRPPQMLSLNVEMDHHHVLVNNL